jgi:hypothetical protein
VLKNASYVVDSADAAEFANLARALRTNGSALLRRLMLEFIRREKRKASSGRGTNVSRKT